MQRPPARPKDKNSRPGFLEIDTPLVTIGVAPDHFIPPPQSGTRLQAGPFGPGVSTYNQNRGTVINTTRALEQEYQTRSAQLPATLEAELTATRNEGPTDPVPPLQSIARELGVLNKVTERKTAELNIKSASANAFYGGDPFNRHINEFMLKATKMEKWPGPEGIAMQALNQSLRAAIEVRLLSQTLQSLHQRTVDLQHTFNGMQAAEQARLAAEQEAQRVAAEQARIRAEAEALAFAQEQARLAALAEAERMAGEQARIAAEAAARYIAAEQARLEAEAEVKRQAEQLRLENQRQAEEQALREAMAALDAAKEVRSFPVSGAAAASGPVFTVAAGTLAVDAVTQLAIKTALRSAAATAITALAAAIGTASGVVIVVGVAALVYYALRDNKEPYALSVPLSDLTTYDADELHAIALANGEIELPVTVGAKTVDDATEYSVVATNGNTVPRKVPVRLAIYDQVLKIYRTETPDAQSPGMTWTPIVRPGDTSTTLPVKEPDVAPYTGASANAIEGRVDTNPELDLYSFGGFIYVFPIESGIPPQYVMFNTPYEGAIVEGENSGRDFNPQESGGPITDIEWASASASQEGVIIVKLHTSKFLQSDANDVMIDRLERILRGELEMTDTDKRFYTHEIREFERFKALGYGDTEMPDPESPAWNNVHTATLEDFKLKDDPSLLYTPEALAAAEKQDERDYQRFLKEIWK
ncbi:S-type pyocin domain-containing protein [Pseudomonas sp. PLMAX]|uniref:S-type pyocin domain-containing protein n=1 Tax=Pseudomonas sp. PLMAX TaxID=2201998 RepID=UPI0038BD82E5